MWVIQRIKSLGACEANLLNVLRCQVLSVLQFAVPAWTTMLIKSESKSIESVQKTGLYLIYGAKFRSYTWALQEANMRTQVEQRRKLFEKFTKACVRSQKFSKWFCKTNNTQLMTTQSRKVRFKPAPARTQQYANSPIPQMVEFANKLGLSEATTLKLNSGRSIML